MECAHFSNLEKRFISTAACKSGRIHTAVSLRFMAFPSFWILFYPLHIEKRPRFRTVPDRGRFAFEWAFNLFVLADAGFETAANRLQELGRVQLSGRTVAERDQIAGHFAVFNRLQRRFFEIVRKMNQFGNLVEFRAFAQRTARAKW